MLDGYLQPPTQPPTPRDEYFLKLVEEPPPPLPPPGYEHFLKDRNCENIIFAYMCSVKMKLLCEGVKKLLPEQTDTHRQIHTQTDTIANITYLHSRVVYNCIFINRQFHEALHMASWPVTFFIQSNSLRLLYHALWLVEKSNRPRSHVPRASWNCLLDRLFSVSCDK